MSLFELKIDPNLVERGVRALERISQILEQYCLPKPSPVNFKPAPPEALSEFDHEAEALREEEEDRRAALGLPPL